MSLRPPDEKQLYFTSSMTPCRLRSKSLTTWRKHHLFYIYSKKRTTMISKLFNLTLSSDSFSPLNTNNGRKLKKKGPMTPLAFLQSPCSPWLTLCMRANRKKNTHTQTEQCLYMQKVEFTYPSAFSPASLEKALSGTAQSTPHASGATSSANLHSNTMNNRRPISTTLIKRTKGSIPLFAAVVS